MKAASAEATAWHRETRGGQFSLYPVDEKRTLLVSRSRVRARTVWAWLLTAVIEPAGFVMTRRMLLGLKQRAEALAAVGGDSSVRAA